MHQNLVLCVLHGCVTHGVQMVQAAVSLARLLAFVTWTFSQSPCRLLPEVRTIGGGTVDLVILVPAQSFGWKNGVCVAMNQTPLDECDKTRRIGRGETHVCHDGEEGL